MNGVFIILISLPGIPGLVAFDCLRGQCEDDMPDHPLLWFLSITIGLPVVHG